jgi:hypothetical protein
MKVNIYETVEVNDEQRKAIAATIDDADARPRQATRDEIKGYVWEHGRHWETVLNGDLIEANEPAPDDDELANLI